MSEADQNQVTNLKPKAAMRSLLVIVLDVDAQHALEVQGGRR